MTDWRNYLVSLGVIATCFLLSPLLFPDNPGISEKLMYALFAVLGLPVTVTAIDAVHRRITKGAKK